MPCTMDPPVVKQVLKGVTVHPIDGGGAQVCITVPCTSAGDQDVGSVSLTINLDARQGFDFAVASVRSSTGKPQFCGYMASGCDPMCPVHQHT